jgi:hypothetical protein
MASLSNLPFWRTDYRIDDDLLEYIFETSNRKVDMAILEPVLTKAKEALGISNLPSPTARSEEKGKKHNTESSRTYSIPIAEQLVTFVDRFLHDQSQSIESATEVV